MKHVLILAFTCAGLMAQSQWPKEPNSFLGVTFGSSLRDASAIVTFTAYACTEIDSDTDCALTYHLTPVLDTDFHFVFQHDRFVHVFGMFNNLGYPEVKAILVERYGKSMAREVGQVQSGAGAIFQNETLSWNGRTMFLSVSKYGTRVDEGMIFLSMNSYLLDKEREHAKAKKKGASGL